MTKYFVFIGLFTFYLPSIIAQNGWTKGKNKLYAQSSISAFSSRNYQNLDGVLFDQGSTLQSKSLALYAEYGITDRLTTEIEFPFLIVNQYNTTLPVYGLGSAKIGLKYGIYKKIPISFSVMADIPTNKGINLSRSKELNEIGTYDFINLPTTDGELNILSTLAISQSTKTGRTFASLYSTLNARTQGYSNQLIVGGEIGQLFFNKLYIIGKIRIQESLSNEPNPAVSFVYGEGTTFTFVNLTTMWTLNNHWKLVGSYSNLNGIIIPARNAYTGNTFSLGVAYEVK